MAKAKTALADSLANLAASLGAGKDKLAGDSFFIAPLSREQLDAMYRGDWLARKIVDIVPYDMIREWREWAGDAKAVDRAEAVEKKFRYPKVVQRALTIGRLYGGAAIVIGTKEEKPEALAEELVAEDVKEGDIRFLHVVNRWQITPFDLIRDTLDPYFGEPSKYHVASATRGTIELHPSRVVRFLGNELPDPIDRPATDGQGWGDSLLQTVYDAVHAVSLSATGIATLVHEAKTDVINVPGLSEHLATQATTDQLTKRFSYASMMKSINNMLLLGDGEEWNRHQINFTGLPDVLRLFLQIAAGAADIPVTRLLGQSPAGLSSTGESDTRNYYDMLSSRQEVDLRPQLERLDEILIRSAGVAPDAVSFEFRPLWQMTEAEKAELRLKKAQATAVYATNALLPEPVLQKAVQEQLIEDGVYPNLKQIAEDFDDEDDSEELEPGDEPSEGAESEETSA
ncbi:MAG: DUF1073 domain-containing protein [Methylocystis sp.]